MSEIEKKKNFIHRYLKNKFSKSDITETFDFDSNSCKFNVILRESSDHYHLFIRQEYLEDKNYTLGQLRNCLKEKNVSELMKNAGSVSIDKKGKIHPNPD